MTNQQDTGAQRIDNPQCHIPKRLYNLKESAIYLGRTVCALREVIWDGKIPYVKDGRRIFLDINDMNDWIDRNKTKTMY